MFSERSVKEVVGNNLMPDEERNEESTEIGGVDIVQQRPNLFRSDSVAVTGDNSSNKDTLSSPLVDYEVYEEEETKEELERQESKRLETEQQEPKQEKQDDDDKPKREELAAVLTRDENEINSSDTDETNSSATEDDDTEELTKHMTRKRKHQYVNDDDKDDGKVVLRAREIRDGKCVACYPRPVGWPFSSQ